MPAEPPSVESFALASFLLSPSIMCVSFLLISLDQCFFVFGDLNEAWYILGDDCENLMAATWSGVSQEAMAIRQDTREVPEIDVFGQMRVPVWKKPTSAKLEQPALSRSGLGVVTARNGDVLHTERDIELHLGLALKGATTGRLGLHVSIYHKHLHKAHAQTFHCP
jgi:hypothetical protein